MNQLFISYSLWVIIKVLLNSLILYLILRAINCTKFKRESSGKK